METADMLCKSLFRWLGNREKCADMLKKLAQELEDVPQGSNIAQGGGGDTSVAAISVRAAFISMCKDLASDSTAKEEGVYWSTFDKATELIKEDEKVGTSIQKQLRELKDRCGETLKARCGETLKDRCGEVPHDDELDCEVATRLMWALAEKRKTPVPLDFLRGFNRATFFRHMTPGGLTPAEASDLICQALRLDRSPEITSSLKVSAKEMMKNIELIGTKAEAGSRALGATGLGISLCDLIGECEELVKGNRVPEASKILRDSARETLEGQQELKEQLDAMNEIIQKLFRMKNLIKDLGKYSLSMTEDAQKIVNYIIGTCTDDTVLSWVQGSNQIEFVNLLLFFREKLEYIRENNLELLTGNLTNLDGNHIDIVLVAHGRIVDQFMPAGALVPTPNIRDTILYSPWNCAIDAKAAFAIAQGSIQATNRMFFNIAHCEPIPLPDHWNSMRASRHNIPVIYLSPVTPEEKVWELFYQLWENSRLQINNRVIIPFVVPQDLVNAFGEIPLHIIILVTSYILSCYNRTATVHLAACLSRTQRVVQYACTSDGMCMTVNMDDGDMDLVLFTALSSMFDRNRR